MTDIEFNRAATGRTMIMGILNCTPDSFSDGGKFFDKDSAVAHALKMAEEGADIVDIGGESTRPGYTPVEEDEEIRRVVPVIKELSSHGLIMSVDTTKIKVAEASFEAGCQIINDIGGDLKGSGMADCAASLGAYLVIMFNCRINGECDGSVANRAKTEIDENIEYALSRGVAESRIIVDPGIGFGTTRPQDIELTKMVRDLAEGPYPVLYAASRKRIVKDLSSFAEDPDLKDDASDALALYSATAGASIVRSHRIAPLKAQLEIIDRLIGG